MTATAFVGGLRAGPAAKGPAAPGQVAGVLVRLVVACWLALFFHAAIAQERTASPVVFEQLDEAGNARMVTLPWHMARARLDHDTTAPVRLTIAPGTEALAVSRVLGTLHLRWNGQSVDMPSMLDARNPLMPMAIVLPPSLALHGGTLEGVLVAPAGYLGEIGTIEAGQRAEIVQAVGESRYRAVLFQLLFAGMALGICLAAVLYWVVRPGDALTTYLVLATLTLSGRWLLIHGLGLPDQRSFSGQVTVLCNLASLAFLSCYAWRRMAPAGGPGERVVLGLGALLALALMMGGQTAQWHRWALVAYGVLAVGWLSAHGIASRQLPRDREILIIVSLSAFQVVSSAVNMARFGTPLTASNLQVPLYLGPLFLVLWGFVTAGRFDGMLRHYRSLSQTLERQVHQARIDLEQAFESMRKAERSRLLGDERARLAQEMHDGVGGKLTAALHILRREGQSEVARGVLQDALTEMRLFMDAMEPHEGDLATVIGNLRYRLEPRLNAAGFALVWHADESTARLDLSTSDVLHVQRIVEEALTNAIKHSGGSEIALSLSFDPGSEAVIVDIQDNGHGLAAAPPMSGDRGKGLANMRKRADLLGARLETSASASGSRVRLLLFPDAERPGPAAH